MSPYWKFLALSSSPCSPPVCPDSPPRQMACLRASQDLLPGTLSRKCSYGSDWLLLAQVNVNSHEAKGCTHGITVRSSSSQIRIKSVPTLGAVTILAPGTRLRGSPPMELMFTGWLPTGSFPSASPLSPLKAELGGPPTGQKEA